VDPGVGFALKTHRAAVMSKELAWAGAQSTLVMLKMVCVAVAIPYSSVVRTSAAEGFSTASWPALLQGG